MIWMGNGDNARCIFPLTSLQIGDLQSYLSDLNLFLAPESRKLYILVDNRPWLQDLVSGPAHFWQLMVTKSRLSPFANSKRLKERNSKLSSIKSKKFKRLTALIGAATLSRKRALLPVKKLRHSLVLNSNLHRTLYGFIVFEVAWTDVRGINYLNELQCDTYLAIEAKFMKRWEFDSIAQAARCISSWFTGTHTEKFLLKEHLDSEIGEVFYDAQENFPDTISTNDDEKIFSDDLCGVDGSPCCFSGSFGVYPETVENRTIVPHGPHPPDGPCKRRKVTRSVGTGVEFDIYLEETSSDTSGSHSQISYASDCEEAVEALHYRDVLLLFRFSDHILPFKLKEIIMSDLRLLTLLELGLPSWVIFLQSYPVLCHLYRPWMNPLARALYGLISTVTVLIGFYDLYKNVPVLKATASRLFGPFFDWIETWEMLSRIKYLGTMLFLHNFKKAVKGFLKITRAMKSLLSFITQPIAGPFMELFHLLLPVWNICILVAEGLCSVIWIVIDSSYSLVENLVEAILFPLWFILSVIWNIAISVLYPIFWILLEILYAPVRIVVGLSGLLAFICIRIYHMIGHIWVSLSSLFKFASGAEATVRTYEVSIWRSLWNDLFSQVFRALRSILYGFSAFFTACNRHRLSIYNHSKEFIQRLRHSDQRSQIADPSQGGQTSETEKLLNSREESPPK